MSVTYCIGNLSAKRRFFLAHDVCADNEDILGYFSHGGKLYALQGEMPFGNMTVGDYVAYKCSLCQDHALSKSEIRFKLRKAGLNLPVSRRMKNLHPITFRLLKVATRLSVDTKEIYVNLDGLCYSAYALTKLKALTSALEEKYRVFVAVSDSRFIPRGAQILNFESGKDPSFVAAAEKWKSRPASKKAAFDFIKLYKAPIARFSRIKRPILITCRKGAR